MVEATLPLTWLVRDNINHAYTNMYVHHSQMLPLILSQEYASSLGEPLLLPRCLSLFSFLDVTWISLSLFSLSPYPSFSIPLVLLSNSLSFTLSLAYLFFSSSSFSHIKLFFSLPTSLIKSPQNFSRTFRGVSPFPRLSKTCLCMNYPQWDLRSSEFLLVFFLPMRPFCLQLQFVQVFIAWLPVSRLFFTMPTLVFLLLPTIFNRFHSERKLLLKLDNFHRFRRIINVTHLNLFWSYMVHRIFNGELRFFFFFQFFLFVFWSCTYSIIFHIFLFSALYLLHFCKTLSQSYFLISIFHNFFSILSDSSFHLFTLFTYFWLLDHITLVNTNLPFSFHLSVFEWISFSNPFPAYLWTSLSLFLCHARWGSTIHFSLRIDFNSLLLMKFCLNIFYHGLKF